MRYSFIVEELQVTGDSIVCNIGVEFEGVHKQKLENIISLLQIATDINLTRFDYGFLNGENEMWESFVRLDEKLTAIYLIDFINSSLLEKQMKSAFMSRHQEHIENMQRTNHKRGDVSKVFADVKNDNDLNFNQYKAKLIALMYDIEESIQFVQGDSSALIICNGVNENVESSSFGEFTFDVIYGGNIFGLDVICPIEAVTLKDVLKLHENMYCLFDLERLTEF